MPSMPRRLALCLALWAVSLIGLMGLAPQAARAQSIKILVQSSPLAGFQYYAGKAQWGDMHEGDKLTLVREPDNAHDANAVRVEWQSVKLGYLPRAENRAVAEEMDKGGKVEARIARLTQHRNPWKRVLVDVYLGL